MTIVNVSPDENDIILGFDNPSNLFAKKNEENRNKTPSEKEEDQQEQQDQDEKDKLNQKCPSCPLPIYYELSWKIPESFIWWFPFEGNLIFLIACLIALIAGFLIACLENSFRGDFSGCFSGVHMSARTWSAGG